jgi:signal-transduction protein with cAMP-binding, CBS, and nucleotidyltransferase domain
MQTNKFFQKLMEKKDDRFELNRLYKRLNLEFYEENSLIIKEGDIGDKFYIIIRGACAVLNKGIKEEKYDNYYDLLMFMLTNEKFWREKEKPLDSHSGCVQRFMNLIPKRELRRLNEKWKSLAGWITFINEMIAHLKTDSEPKIAEYYGMDTSDQGKETMDNLRENMLFLK